MTIDCKSKIYRNIYSLWLFVASLESFLRDGECTSAAEVDQHLQMGIQLLSRGQMHDALSHFHAAIDGDPSNYMSYYRRATVYLALGRAKPGLVDLDHVIQLKPDFNSARAQKAGVLLKLGRLDEAFIEAEKVLQKDPQNVDAGLLMSNIEPIKRKYLYAQSYVESGHYNDALSAIKEIVEECPWDASIRDLRVKAYQGMGDIMSAIAELRTAAKLIQDNTEGYLKLSRLYYQVGDLEQSLGEIRECLKLDPDHRECFPFYKKVKKVNKAAADAQENINSKEYSDCVTSANIILREEPSEPEVRFIAFDKLCQCQGQAGDASDALESCDEALRIKEDPRIYCDRAEVHLLFDNFDDALKDFQRASEIDHNYQRARDGKEKVQKLEKQAKKRDYYKILGVKRNASKRDITKAYRALAQKWHPDHYQGEEKQKAEKMFIDIAAAKEVLTDDEKRAKFDAGEDPLDPEQQTGPFSHGFNPFQGFHFPRGFPGGFQDGFTFKFHFN